MFQIDFNAVGEATKLKAPAARMRYTRLRRAIESGTLIGTHGTPFQGGADKIAESQKKGKMSTPLEQTTKEDGVLHDQAEVVELRSRPRRTQKHPNLKMEDATSSTDEDETDGEYEEEVQPKKKRHTRTMARKRRKEASVVPDHLDPATETVVSSGEEEHARSVAQAIVQKTLTSDGTLGVKRERQHPSSAGVVWQTQQTASGDSERFTGFRSNDYSTLKIDVASAPEKVIKRERTG